MANRREEERERLRQVREQRESSRSQKARRRVLAGYGAAGLVGLVVLVGVVMAVASSVGGEDAGGAHINQGSGSTNGVAPDQREGVEPAAAKVTDLEKAAERAGCDLRLNVRDEGKTHIPTTARTPDYETNPPTSGNHVEPPYQQADGAYSEMPGEINMVHSLEHGRVQFQYSPDLPEQAQLELKGMYDTMFGGVLLFPNDNMDYEVAATAWTNLIGCSEYKGAITLDALRAFARKTWGRFGGEPVNAFGLKGPTPIEPRS